LGSSPDAPIVRIITKMNFIPLPPSQKHPRTYSAFYTKYPITPPWQDRRGGQERIPWIIWWIASGYQLMNIKEGLCGQ
jgi:hypothetical protein